MSLQNKENELSRQTVFISLLNLNVSYYLLIIPYCHTFSLLTLRELFPETLLIQYKLNMIRY